MRGKILANNYGSKTKARRRSQDFLTEYHLLSSGGARVSALQRVLANRPRPLDGRVSQALRRIDQVAGQVLGAPGEKRTGLVRALDQGAAMEGTVRQVVRRRPTQSQRQLP